MARTIETIYNAIITEKETSATLNSGLLPSGTTYNDLISDLDSKSKVSVWRLWAYITAVSIWVVEKLFDEHKTEVDTKIASSVYGNDLWWVDRMKEFQFGDNLIVTEVNGEKVLTYGTIDTAKQIIDFVSITDTVNGGSIIKVAKDDGAGLPEALTTAELTGATEFVDRIQPAGASLSVISQNSDLVQYNVDIYYNGLLDLTTIQSAVITAVDTYHQNLEFNGEVILSKVVDAIQGVEGVEDVVITQAQGKQAGGTYATFNRAYETSSGHVKVDPSNDLTTTANYIVF